MYTSTPFTASITRAHSIKQSRLKALMLLKLTQLSKMTKMFKSWQVWILIINLPSARRSLLRKDRCRSKVQSKWCSEDRWMVLWAESIWLNTYQAWQVGPSRNPLLTPWTKHKPLSQSTLTQRIMILLLRCLRLTMPTWFLNRPMRHRKRNKNGVSPGPAPRRCIT